MIGETRRECWCGEGRLAAFSAEYKVCQACGTLVSQAGLSSEQLQVRDDGHDFYGKEYWLSHMTHDLGFPDIRARARQDLSERCLHWLRTALAYRPAPASALELGCAHGAFVALLRWAGYDATGLEMSPWVVNFARQTFGIPGLVGPVEQQDLHAASLDLIAHHDVLEHLPDPFASMRRCAELLRPDGTMIVQTPEFPLGKTYDQLVAENHRFLEHIHGKANEHLYLFSRKAVSRLFERLGFASPRFETPMYDYDMYLIIGRTPPVRRSDEQIDADLAALPTGRLIQALFDLHKRWQVSEEDRAARLGVINRLNEGVQVIQAARAAEMQAARDQGQAEVQAARAHGKAELEALRVTALEALKAASLEVIEGMNKGLAAVNEARANEAKALEGQARGLALEVLRAAGHETIQKLQAEVAHTHALVAQMHAARTSEVHAAQAEVIRRLNDQLAATQAHLADVAGRLAAAETRLSTGVYGMARRVKRLPRRILRRLIPRPAA